MSWWSKLFGGKDAKAPEAPAAASAPEPASARAAWVPADQNRFGVPVLDLLAVTGGLISTTTDPQRAAMAMSWGRTLVADLAPAFAAKETLACHLRYRADRELPDGWLFVPAKMEQKWAIAYRGGAIWLVRSWTGQAHAVGHARRDGDDLVVERVEVADDALRTFGDPIETFDWILRAHALGEILPLPVDAEGAKLLEATPLAVFGPYGHVATCAATSWRPPPQPRPLRTRGDLTTAVAREDAARVTALARAGAPVNARAPGGLTALHVAAIKANVELTRTLLEVGADPNVLDDREQSVVITAVVHHAPTELLDLLVARGADVARANADGFGMIHAIAETDQPAYLPWALAHGLTLEARTRHGHAPLHIAAGLGHVAVLRALLAAGADRDARDPSGKTPRDVAVAEGKAEAAAALA